jgi:hypothetical protein
VLGKEGIERTQFSCRPLIQKIRFQSVVNEKDSRRVKTRTRKKNLKRELKNRTQKYNYGSDESGHHDKLILQ